MIDVIKSPLTPFILTLTFHYSNCNYKFTLIKQKSTPITLKFQKNDSCGQNDPDI